MSLAFEPVELDRQAEYLTFLDACPVKTSDYSFVNLWSWADTYGLMWAWSPHLVWIKQMHPREAFWAPVGDWRQADWGDDLLQTVGSWTRVPETLVGLWQDRFGDRLAAEAARSHWDYLYSIPELVSLKGNRFHKKKNLINQFKKNYEFRYVPLTDEVIHLAAGMQESWCTWRDCESNEALDAENAAIVKVLKNWRKLERLAGGALIIDGDIAAYTIAEGLTEDMLLIHFEKGNPVYKGAYQAINQMFLDQNGSGRRMVNREQDLGDEGLRKAKLSYHPIDFLKKYTVTIL